MAYCISALLWASKQRRGEYGVRRKTAGERRSAAGTELYAGNQKQD